MENIFMLKFGCCFPPNKIFVNAPGSTACIYQKILSFAFDSIYVVIITSSIFYLSKLTKFELCLFELSELMCFHIKCSAKSRYLDIAPLHTSIH